MEDEGMLDICLNCGKEYEPVVWCEKCDCNNPNVVHRQKCDGCDSIIGFVIDDDYCGIDKLYCSTCINK